MSMLRPALTTFAALAILTGLAYPLAITGVGQVVFPGKANGSLLVRNGQIVGSELIGQYTDDPKYFWGRLSATGDFPTNAANSGGSNLASSNPGLQKAAQQRIQMLQAADPTRATPVPVDLVTASGSGLDPHITPAAAGYQIRRVARARGLTEATLRDLVRQHTEGRTLGVLGEPRVNVLALNLSLDDLRP
jgi:K+-transporting ATPase ATPase C chain